LATESDEHRYTRLDRMREAYQERLAAETAQERESPGNGTAGSALFKEKYRSFTVRFHH